MKRHCYSRRSCYDGGRYWGVGVHETASVGAGLDIGQMGELVKPADCKSAAYGIVGSSPTLPTKSLVPDGGSYTGTIRAG